MIPAIALGLYGAGLLGAAAFAWRRTRAFEDFTVAGRRLGTPLATLGLLATWFGAGTLLASAEAVREQGIQAAALEPVGPGICLILVGLFYAVPLRRAGLLTLGDFFAARFDRRAEVLAALVMVASFFGWIAAQFTVLGALVADLTGVPPLPALALVAGITVLYTMIGGMWSVTLTDAAQMALVAAGLGAVAVFAFTEFGDGSPLAGLARLGRETPPELLRPFPAEAGPFLMWGGFLAAGALGNIPGQDVMQRVLSCRTGAAARRSCILAGVLYCALGALPVLLGLLAGRMLPGESDLLDALLGMLFSPLATVVVMLLIVSALLSTVDSALMAAGSVLGRNLLRHLFPRADALLLTRLAVLLVGALSLLQGLAGASAWSLLADAYQLTLVGLFVPLTLGLFSRRGGARAALISMGTGAGLQLLHTALGWETFLAPLLPFPVPNAFALTALSALGYRLGMRRRIPACTPAN